MVDPQGAIKIFERESNFKKRYNQAGNGDYWLPASLY